MQKEAQEKPQYAIVAAVQLPSVSDVEFEASLTELRELAKTLGFTVTRTFTQKRSGFDSTAYLGVGKREEIRRFVRGEPASETEPDHAPQNPLHRLSTLVEGLDDEVSPHPIDVVFVDHEISPSQARHLENEVGCQVMDRTMVILEIFHRNARSPAARAQVEIARLGY
ncbi:MAG: GTPase HflX, partial [Thiobacillus sp.]